MGLLQIATLLISTGLGVGLAILALRGRKMVDLEKSTAKAEKLMNESKEEAEEILEKAKKESEKRKEKTVEDEKQAKELLQKMSEGADLKESSVKKQEEKINSLKQKISSYEGNLKALEKEIEKLHQGATEKLAQRSGQDIGTLKKDLIQQLKKELEFEKGEKLQFSEDLLKENASKIAEKVVVNAIQRLSSATSVERRMINVKVPKDKLKGKIVGKGGKNIRYFEAKLGVDVMFNDQPNTISVSAFNLVNRKIAERAIKQLFKVKTDINEKTIDQAIKKASEETDKDLYNLGKKGAEAIGIKSKDEELLRTIGRLQYRTSYGQNIMLHSLEVGWLAIMMGTEIGLDFETLKNGGFLHDLGKAIDQDPSINETHDVLTKELMEQHKFSWEDVHAAWTHHDSVPLETAEAMIVKAADAISASRPGARQESMDKYIQRLKDLEGTAGSYAGVKKAFAISAGRELRVIVYPEEIKDQGLEELATDIAGDVQENITYPGQVKVNVIRKTKAVDVAK